HRLTGRYLPRRSSISVVKLERYPEGMQLIRFAIGKRHLPLSEAAHRSEHFLGKREVKLIQRALEINTFSSRMLPCRLCVFSAFPPCSTEFVSSERPPQNHVQEMLKVCRLLNHLVVHIVSSLQ